MYRLRITNVAFVLNVLQMHCRITSITVLLLNVLQVRYLKDKLLASEETVQLLSKKNEAYLSALEAAGLSMLQMNRSNSESCLGSNPRSGGRRRSSSGDLSLWISSGQHGTQLRLLCLNCGLFLNSHPVVQLTH